ncbi:hypothetical protein WJN01_09290 [Flavobacteriaceae bacterium SZ-1-7]|uniref:hypothetical protein n=1 Tax=Tamlana sedimenti TaxID=3134126 RepID=UPI003123FC8F
MIRLIGKIILYTILILICLEGMVRVLHLYQQYPPYEINDLNVEVNSPNQEGYYVTGNRRMNFAQYHINSTGFNSYREFIPTENDVEIALIGDSFIEGFHQNFYESTGKKVEELLNNDVKVFEYGYSGWDLADQFHLIEAYKDQFKNIDFTLIYMKFYTDLERGEYEPNFYRVNLQNRLTYKIKDNIKLLTYAQNIGIFNPFSKLKNRLLGHNEIEKEYIDNYASEEDTKKYLENFNKLAATFPIDKSKTVFLLDSKKTSPLFLKYCDSIGYKYLDFGPAMDASKKPTTLIYDQHWNNHGRNILASVIANYIKKQKVIN